MKRATLILFAFLLGACGQQSAEQPAGPEPAAAPAASVYEAAVANDARPEADRARDAQRKPADVLEFVGIAPGMKVLDMFSGGGYYTEIMSYIVGDNGMVVAHSNEAYLGFVGEEFEQRYLGGRLPNTEILMAENNELSLESASFDAIMLVLSFHDLYFENVDDGWPAIDVDAFLAELYKGLRPGGVVGIVDHRAASGTPVETVASLHRIDPAIVLETMTKAGFTQEAGSDMLRNPNDDLSLSVFDDAVRGKTDRFVMRFRKPE